MVSENRTWKSKSGSTVEGRLVYLYGPKAVIESSTKKVITLTLDQLSKPDQDFLKAWEKSKSEHWSIFQEIDLAASSSLGPKPSVSPPFFIIPVYDAPVVLHRDGTVKGEYRLNLAISPEGRNLLSTAKLWKIKSKVRITGPYYSGVAELKVEGGIIKLTSTKLNNVSLSSGKGEIMVHIDNNGKAMSNRLRIEAIVE